MKRLLLSLPLLLAAPAFAGDFTINDYNEQLPVWGTSWSGGYRPSFYTGFAARQQSPERIHIRTARGNQTRVSVILDEQTLADYTFDLAKRYSFYKKAQKSLISNTKGEILPQLDSFYKIVESSAYGILPFTSQGASASQEALTAKGLEVLRALNPGRVFDIRLNLTAEFAKWKAQARENSSWANAGYLASNPKEAVVAINTLVFGRVNYTGKPDSALLSKVADLAALAQTEDASFPLAAAALFKEVTGKKYDIKVVENGRLERALRCESAASCTLSYPEFTAVYPTGSAESFTKDKFGNTISNFATPGLWSFVSRGSRNVDNIRDEQYYGWIPKMDFEAIGNGFHNPAVRFFKLTRGIREALNVSSSHSEMWLVKRGGVSHGCLRLPAGHVWEMRQILPVEDSKMVQVNFFGNSSTDFDVYDIDGNGQPEVMGVNYLVNYDAKGAREVGAIETNVDSARGKLDFYTRLYGAKGVFTVYGNDIYTFESPSASLPSYLDYKKKSVSARVSVKGEIPLYEQAYEQDKIQFYNASINKMAIRLMGRVRGCAPTSNKQTCGEAAFDKEASSYVR
jgi:hypothetical protein